MLFPNKMFMSNCWTYHVVCQIGAKGRFLGLLGAKSLTLALSHRMGEGSANAEFVRERSTRVNVRKAAEWHSAIQQNAILRYTEGNSRGMKMQQMGTVRLNGTGKFALTLTPKLTLTLTLSQRERGNPPSATRQRHRELLRCAAKVD